MLAVFVAAAAGHSRLGEVHDLECVLLTLDATFGTEVKPLLVTASVGVDLHEQVVGVWLQGIALGLQEIARLKQ